jgi:hypothetical protein
MNNGKKPSTLPSCVGGQLRLMMGAGDLNQDGLLNIERFETYNVFLCQPWNDRNGSLRGNVEYLINSTTAKLLCFMDIDDKLQVEAFTDLFKGRFSFIDGYGGHCPHFEMCDIKKLLCVGGKATNIYEYCENLMPYNHFMSFLDNGQTPFTSPFGNGQVMSHFWLHSKLFVQSNDDMLLLYRKMRQKILELIDIASNIGFTKDTISDIETMPIHCYGDEVNPLISLQHILRILMLNDQLKENHLFGSFEMMRKDWMNDEEPTLVVTNEEPTKSSSSSNSCSSISSSGGGSPR